MKRAIAWLLTLALLISSLPLETMATTVITEPAGTVQVNNTSTEPSTEATEPSTEATEPSTEATEPSTEATEPSTEATEPSMEGTEPSTEPVVPSEITVHYYNTDKWAAVYAQVQGSYASDIVWPGTELTEEANHVGWYTATVLDEDGSFVCNFNNGIDIAADIPVAYTEEIQEFWYWKGQLLSAMPEEWIYPPVDVTRAQWIQLMVETFAMTVEEGSYPENYYSDLTGSEDYYRDIMIAVEFGIIDLDAGLPFHPKAAASREFAAHTLNFALGFQLDEETEYTFVEAAAVTYPADIQVAINRNWFALESGAFLPEAAITLAEKSGMLADAELILNSVPDESLENTVSFADGVIEIPRGTEISMNDAGQLVIFDSAVSLTAGNVFIAYDGEFPVAFVATAVEKDGNNLIVSVTTEGTENAISDFYYNGTINADLEQFVPAEATTYKLGTYTVNSGATTYGISYNPTSKTLNASKTFTIKDSLKATVDCDVENVKLDLHIDKAKDQYRAVFSGTTKSTFSVHGDLLEALTTQNAITIGYVPILFGTAYIEIAVEYSLNGEISLVWQGDIKAGFSYDSGNYRLVKNFTKRSFSFSADVTAKLGVRMDIGIDLWLLDASIWAAVGAQMHLQDVIYTDGVPERCQDYEGFLYVNVGAKAKIFGIKAFKVEEDLLKKSNSPVRVHYHIEDGVSVTSCSRSDDFSDYVTDPSSKNYNSSYGNVSSHYTNSDGEVVRIYSYTLNDSNEATITGYYGSATTLILPAVLDGYNVVAIGSSAFAENTALCTVKIPVGISSIGNYAFDGCSNLVCVSMSSSLTTIGNYAFRDCLKLVTSIPATVTSIGNYAFYNCDTLTEITLEASGITLGNYAFAHCSSLETVSLPDSTLFGQYVFNGLSVKVRVTCDTGIIPSKFMCYYNTQYTSNYDEYLKNYRGAGVCEVEICEGITQIGSYAFYNGRHTDEQSPLKNVTLPSTVTVIGEKAFYGCNSLSEIVMPNGEEDILTTIGSYAFSDCSALERIEIPLGVKTIPGGAFYGCSSLTEPILPTTVVTISGSAFRNCTSLTDPNLPSSVTSIGNYAYYGCSALSALSFPAELTTIGEDAFASCTALRELVLTDNITSVGIYAFSNCTALQDVVFGTGLSELSKGMFNSCSQLENVTIPNSVSNIGESAFGYCGTINVYAPDSVTYGDHVFIGCSAALTITSNRGYIPDEILKSKEWDANNYYDDNKLDGIVEIHIGEGITSIGYRAFYTKGYSSSLKVVTLPESLLSIETEVFYGCSALESINIPENVTSLPSYLFYGCSSLKDIALHKDIVSIGNYAFYGCASLEEMVIPDSVTSLGTCLFYGCSNLRSVKLPSTCRSITDRMFQNCTSLENLQFPTMVTTIGAGAFWSCSALTDIDWPASITTVGDSAFRDCDSLIGVVVPESVTNFGVVVFAECDNLKEVTLPSGISVIPNYTFSGCSSLEGYIITEQITAIGNYAFRNCDALTEITIPDNITSLGDFAFYDCDSLTAIDLPNSVTSIGASCFYSCDALADVHLSEGLTSIPDSAFMDCQSITEITIPRYVTTLSTNAFSVCPALVKVFISASVTSINASAFSYPDRLVIYGLPGTYAETFAADNGFLFADGTLGADSASLNHKTLTMNRGTSATLVLTVEPENHTDTVTWKSSNTTVVTVTDKGVVTAVGIGTATIKVNVGDVGASCKITVVEPITAIKLDKTALNFEALETYQLTATISPDNAYNKTLTWSSANSAIASVDENGLITALSKGTTTITAAATDGSGITASCTVTVSNTGYVANDIAELESPHNYSNNCTDFWLYSVANAEELHVTFDANTEMEDGFDYLYLFDADGNAVCTYTGTELAGQTVTIPGNTVKIQIISDESGTEWGFKVTDITGKLSVDTAYAGMSLSLNGDIGVNFYMTISEEHLEDENLRMVFNVGGKAYEMALEDALTDTQDDGSVCYRFSCSVPAKGMSDEITAQLYGTDGAIGESKTYCVAQYYSDICDQFSREEKPELFAMVEAMLNYGAAAQEYFGYNIADLANATVTAAVPENVDASAYAAVVSDSDKLLDYAGLSLVLESNTVLRVFFRAVNGADLSSYIFTLGGEVVEPVQKDGLWYVELTDIAAKDLDKVCTVTAGGVTVQCSALSYVHNVLQKADVLNGKLVSLCKALFAYSQTADDYFATKS